MDDRLTRNIDVRSVLALALPLGFFMRARTFSDILGDDAPLAHLHWVQALDCNKVSVVAFDWSAFRRLDSSPELLKEL